MKALTYGLVHVADSDSDTNAAGQTPHPQHLLRGASASGQLDAFRSFAPEPGVMVTDLKPTWWTAHDVDPPDAWIQRFDALTDEEQADRLGLSAGIFIAGTRRRFGHGPTFKELFAALFKDQPLHPEWPEGLNYAARSSILHAFRLHVAVQWKRGGWISWDKDVERSLRVGPTFRQTAREWQASRAR